MMPITMAVFDSNETGIGSARVTVQRVTDSGSDTPDTDFPDDGGWDAWDSIGSEPIVVYTSRRRIMVG